MSKRHSFKTSGESWAFWTFISHQWIAGPQTTTEFPGCLVSCHSLHSCSQKHTLCWKSVLLITSLHPPARPPCMAWAHSLVRMRLWNILQCFYFSCAPLCSALPLVWSSFGQTRILSRNSKREIQWDTSTFCFGWAFNKYRGLLSSQRCWPHVLLGLSGSALNFSKCCYPLPLLRRAL